MNIKELTKTSQEIRKLMLEALRPKESHHIGCSFSIVDILTYLYFKELKVDPKNPKSKNRDIFLLSKGHAGLALYATLCQKGFFPQELMKTYDQDGSRMPEHASTMVPGVELSTGSLGHALPVGIGFALSFRNDKKNNKVFVLLSDGELDEGSNWEAIMFAGYHKLNNLTAIIDLNGFQGYSETKKVIDLSPIAKKVEAFGWNVKECNGHDFESLKICFNQVQSLKKPIMIITKTVKGKGVPYFEGKFESHYKSVDEETKEKILKEFIKL